MVTITFHVYLRGLNFLALFSLLHGYRRFFATTVSGLENVLAAELSVLKAKNVVPQKCGVSFEGDEKTALECIMWLRTSLRVMEIVCEAKNIESKEDLYDLCSSIDWTTYLNPNQSIKCDAVLGAVSMQLSHSHFTSLTVKNALVDQFRSRVGVRPSVDIDNPDVPLLLYLHRGKATLYRVWSGDNSMHKRGYREVVHRAALRETTAAALLYVSGWRSHESLMDPMCGSGTIAVEAALMAADTAPGLLAYGRAGFATGTGRGTGKRSIYGENGNLGDDEATARVEGRRQSPKCLVWPSDENLPALWNSVYATATARDLRAEMQRDKTRPPLIFANDMHEGAIELAVRSAGAAKVHRLIAFSCRDAKDIDLSSAPLSTATSTVASDGVLNIVTNPPWDRRLEGAEQAWEALGVFMERTLAPEGQAWALCGSQCVSRSCGHRPDLSVSINAAGTPLQFLRYRL